MDASTKMYERRYCMEKDRVLLGIAGVLGICAVLAWAVYCARPGWAPRFGEISVELQIPPSGSGSGNTKLCLVWGRCTVREYEIVRREYEDASRGLLYTLHPWHRISTPNSLMIPR